jgi:hypothetical protein
MAQAQRNMYTNSHVEVEVQAIDDVVVRRVRPADTFDEKGKIKKLTRAELKEQKGDPKQPGYKAEFGDLSADQYITLTVVRKKGEPASKPARPAKKKKGKDDDLDADALRDDTPLVNTIMILAEPPPAK